MELGGVAIVTGAGGGIGSAVARHLAAEGFALVLADRSRALLDAAADAVEAEVGRTTTMVTAVGDVGDPSHHAALVTAAEDLGGLTVSVLNAGVYLPGLVWEIPIEQWELQVRVNYWGVVHGVRAAVPAMMRRGRGHVLGMASGAGLVATPALGPYVSTKHAVVGLMETLRHELARVAPGLRASVICPGNVRTPMAAHSLAAAGVADEELSPVAQEVADKVRAGNDAGQDPSTVADAVVEAIRTGRFWVLPQPEVGLGALDRVQRIVAGDEPVDLLG
jgi:NAD(P)-dependent dehydrogenase (short-subunit alcohol dehydrogenase family)